MAAFSIDVSVLVYKGSPLDYQQYRHTALFFNWHDETTPVMIHAAGPPGDYRVELEHGDQHASQGNRTLLKEIQVGQLRADITKAKLVALIYQTPVNNSSREFNCQTWVGDVLQNLVRTQYLSREQCTGGIDGMIDATLEGAEEP